MFGILSDFLASLAWGALAAVIITAAIVLLARAVCTGFYWSLTKIATTTLLFILLLVQCVLFAGAGYALDRVDDVAAVATSVVEGASDFSASLAQNVPDEASELTSQADAALQTGSDKVEQVTSETRETLTAYRWRRIMWMAGFIVVAGIILCMGGRSSGTITYSGGTTSSGLNF